VHLGLGIGIDDDVLNAKHQPKGLGKARDGIAGHGTMRTIASPHDDDGSVAAAALDGGSFDRVNSGSALLLAHAQPTAHL
jgi:hypothetical protein